MNALSISGRLTKNFEFSKGVAKSGLAVDTWDKKTFFIDLVAFKSTAEYIIKGKYTKGSLVVVDGELSINKYNDKIYVQCIVKNIELVDKKDDIVEEDIKVVQSGAEMGLPTSDKEVVDEPNINIEDSDLPF